MNIGLAGPAGSGKNAVADILTRLHGYKQASFAEALRAEVKSAIEYGFGRSEAPCDVWRLVKAAKDLNLEPWQKPTHSVMRQLLQQWGAEFRRTQDPDYWVKRVDRGERMVYTDVRFANERALPTVVWYVLRDSAESARGNHISEQQIFEQDCTLTIDNNGSLEDLAITIQSACVAECRLVRE